MTKIIWIILLFLLMLNQIAFSQEEQITSRIDSLSFKNTGSLKSPIPIETMFGNDKINYLSILNFRLGEQDRFGYFGVTTLSTPYNKDNGTNEFVFSNAITYKLRNNIYVTSGLQYHFLKGIVPYSGLQFLSANPKWLLVMSTNIGLWPKTGFQSVGILEYKPVLSEKLRLYTRFQGVYNFNLDNGFHERSLIYLRTGLTFKRTSLGLGYNLDFYGTNKTRYQNIGLFIHRLF